MREKLLVALAILAIPVGGMLMTGTLAVTWNKVFGTAIESSRTDIYRENKSYVEGTIRDLRNLRIQYEAAEPEQKAGLRSLIMQRANELDWDRLPSDVRRFLEEIR